MRDLVKGKRIVVTGSSSGIGWETARIVSEQGAEVLGVDLNKNFDQATVDPLKQLANDTKKSAQPQQADPDLKGERGVALRALLYLFDRDHAVRLLGSG